MKERKEGERMRGGGMRGRRGDGEGRDRREKGRGAEKRGRGHNAKYKTGSRIRECNQFMSQLTLEHSQRVVI